MSNLFPLLSQRAISNSRLSLRTMTTISSSSTLPKENPLTVHSSFRDEFGKQVRPHGLEWHVDGDSLLSYAPVSKEFAKTVDSAILQEEPSNNSIIKGWIVAAHNKWSFARDWPMRQSKDILNIQWHAESHQFQVRWDPDLSQHYDAQRFTMAEIDGLLKMDKSAQGDEAPAEVWINGYFRGMLSPDTLDNILQEVTAIPSKKLVYRKSPSGIIRIERRFTGMIRGQDVFEHILDNLYALEDPQFVDNHSSQKLIGTATLPDWIMGGELTSRLWIHDELESVGTITFLRPLYEDNIKTSDRRYVLKKGKDDDRISMVQKELDRLRYLATLPSPYELYRTETMKVATTEDTKVSDEKIEKTTAKASPRRTSRRRFFGL